MTNPRNTVFISGSGSGIGLYFARHFANQGSRIALFDLHISDAVREEFITSYGDQKINFYALDICDAAAVTTAVAQATAVLGVPDLAINSAGIQLAKKFLDMSDEEFSRIVDINLGGSRNFAAAVLPQMKKHSQLVFVASLAGLLSNYTYAAYSASKYGAVGLAGVIRMECLPLGIDVTVVCPPEIGTPMVVEELKTMHPITAELKQVTGSLALDPACREIIEGINKRKHMVIPGFKARVIWRLNCWFPGLVQRKTDALILKYAAQGKA